MSWTGETESTFGSASTKKGGAFNDFDFFGSPPPQAKEDRDGGNNGGSKGKSGGEQRLTMSPTNMTDGSGNPFDDFDLSSMYISGPKSDLAPAPSKSPPPSLMAAPSSPKEKKPIMKAPPQPMQPPTMMQPQPQPQMGMGGGMWMQQPPPQMQGMMMGGYGAPPFPQQGQQMYQQPASPRPTSPFDGYISPARSPVAPSSPVAGADPFGGSHYASRSPPPPSSPPPPVPAIEAARSATASPVHHAFVPPANNGAIVPSTVPNDDPFGVFGASSPAPPPAAPSSPVPNSGAVIQSEIPNDDPFGLGAPGSGMPVPPPPTQAPPSPPQGAADEADFWADMGFGAAPTPAPSDPSPAAPAESPKSSDTPPAAETVGDEDDPIELDENGLPTSGEYYDCRINTPKLGAMFFQPQDLRDCLFLDTPKNVVKALADRPVVAYTAENSAAAAAGVGLGHVLINVAGTPVSEPREASKLIREAPRPLVLKFYDPKIKPVVSEGQHLVKYDSRDTTAPGASYEWKPKYVVIGGIIARPYMINMYYNKGDYDKAVLQTQSGQGVTVKVKQFSLLGARILHDDREPRTIGYPNRRDPYRYIVIVPKRGYPIKISSPTLEELRPVHEGIRRYLDQERKMRSEARERYYQSERDAMGGDSPRGYYGRRETYSEYGYQDDYY